MTRTTTALAWVLLAALVVPGQALAQDRPAADGVEGIIVVLDEIDHTLGRVTATVLWDMAKFYDSLSIPLLVKKAEELDFPIKLLC